MSAPVIHFDLATHTYRVGGRVIPSVTQIIGSAGVRGAFTPSDAVMAYACDRGRAVHLACELDDDGTLDERSVHPEVLPYLNAYRQFKAETRYEIVEMELARYDELMGFCGTPDRICVINGRPAVLDLKSGVKMAATGMQLAAYAVLAGHPAASRFSLQLRADGLYRLERYSNPADWPAFVAALTLHNWRVANGLG